MVLMIAVVGDQDGTSYSFALLNVTVGRQNKIYSNGQEVRRDGMFAHRL